MSNDMYKEIEQAPSAWDCVVETARQEAFDAGYKMGLEAAKDKVFSAERQAYRDGRRDAYRKLLATFGLEDL